MIRLDIIANEVCKEYEEVIEKSTLCIKKIKETVERAGLNGKELKTVKFDVDSKYESYRDKNGNYKSRLVGFQYTQKFYMGRPGGPVRPGAWRLGGRARARRRRRRAGSRPGPRVVARRPGPAGSGRRRRGR